MGPSAATSARVDRFARASHLLRAGRLSQQSADPASRLAFSESRSLEFVRAREPGGELPKNDLLQGTFDLAVLTILALGLNQG